MSTLLYTPTSSCLNNQRKPRVSCTQFRGLASIWCTSINILLWREYVWSIHYIFSHHLSRSFDSVESISSDSFSSDSDVFLLRLNLYSHILRHCLNLFHLYMIETIFLLFWNSFQLPCCLCSLKTVSSFSPPGSPTWVIVSFFET